MIDITFLLGLVILLFMLVFIAVVSLGKISILIALPGAAVIIAAIAGVPASTIFSEVLDGGAMANAPIIVTVIFGAVLGEVLAQRGIAQDIVVRAAELGGDRPVLVATFVTAACAFVFVGIYGFAPTIMLGIIAIPILLQMGYPNKVAAAIFSLALGAGTAINITSWALYVPLFNIQLRDFFNFALLVAVASYATVIVMIVVEGKRAGVHIRSMASMTPEKKLVGVPVWAYISPAVPVILVMAFNWPILSSFLVGILYAIFSSYKHGESAKHLAEVFLKSITDAMPQLGFMVFILIGIGMITKAVSLQAVSTVMTPLFSLLIPRNLVILGIAVMILSPLVLYKGPLHPLGVGGAIIKIISGLNIFTPRQIVGVWQGPVAMLRATDPTFSPQAWIYNYCKLDAGQFVRTLLPYTWALSAVVTLLSLFLM